LLWRTKHAFGWATRVAAGAGRAFDYVLVAGGVALLLTSDAWSGIWLALMGGFLVQAATAEARQTPPPRHA
jgi:hypothetical protein